MVIDRLSKGKLVMNGTTNINNGNSMIKGNLFDDDKEDSMEDRNSPLIFNSNNTNKVHK